MNARRVALLACAVASPALAAACRGAGGGASSPDGGGVSGDGGATIDGPLFDADPTPPASLNGVTPSHAFLARHREIQITGFSTRWTTTTNVDLGPGITVTNLSVPTPGLVVVDFGVDLGAATGPRDVRVVNGDGGALVAAAGLTIDPPVALSFTGTLAQGSIVVAHASVLDPSIPLDTTTVLDKFGNASFPDLAPALGAGISGTVTAATPYGADLELFVDVPASGTSNFDLVSGAPDAAATHFPAPSGLDVTTRAPHPLDGDASASGTLAGKYATELFQFVPPSAAPLILDFSATTTATNGDPAVLLLPASGRWADQLLGGSSPTWLSTSTDPIFAVYFDDSGQTGSYSVGVNVTAPAASAAASAADATMTGAVDATALPFALTGGLLASATSQDWVRVTTGPGDAGHHLLVQSAGDPKTFLDVTIYQADGTTSIGGNETGGPVHASAGPLAASSTYYVVFSAGAGFDPAHGAYAGIIRLQ